MTYQGKILSVFLCAVSIVLFQAGCQNFLHKHIQFSTTVPSVTKLKIPENTRVVFLAPELSAVENFRGVLKEFDKPDYYFRSFKGDGISLTQRENFLSQPFNNCFPNLNINDFFIKQRLQKNTGEIETAMPLKDEVTLLSGTVDKINPLRIYYIIN